MSGKSFDVAPWESHRGRLVGPPKTQSRIQPYRRLVISLDVQRPTLEPLLTESFRNRNHEGSTDADPTGLGSDDELPHPSHVGQRTENEISNDPRAALCNQAVRDLVPPVFLRRNRIVHAQLGKEGD